MTPKADLPRRLIDISRPLAPGTAVWPGDPTISVARFASLENGDGANVSKLTACLHAATHADAPIHYDPAGVAIEALPPDLYVGPCRVLDVRGRDPIDVEDLPPSLPPRLVLRTDGWADSAVFPATFPTLSPAAAAELGARGVKLLGVDVPSVDKLDNQGMPIHHALHSGGVLILESLDLHGVEEGEYELIALPLLIPGSDGAFVRAVLRS